MRFINASPFVKSRAEIVLKYLDLYIINTQ